jgi:hypothetical protein
MPDGQGVFEIMVLFTLRLSCTLNQRFPMVLKAFHAGQAVRRTLFTQEHFHEVAADFFACVAEVEEGQVPFGVGGVGFYTPERD